MRHSLLTILLAFLFYQISFTQTESEKISKIIEGEWSIEYQLITSLDKPEIDKLNLFKNELITPTDTSCVFKNGNYSLSIDKSGSYSFKGHSMYLNNEKYKCAYYSEQKFNLIRVINPDLMIGYVFKKKK